MKWAVARVASLMQVREFYSKDEVDNSIQKMRWVSNGEVRVSNVARSF